MSVPAAEVKKETSAKAGNGFLGSVWMSIKRNASWSWVSLPSLLLAWILIATQFEDYIFPQPWDVLVEEGWNTQLFPEPPTIVDEAGNKIPYKLDDDGNEIPLTAEERRGTFERLMDGEFSNAFSYFFRGELWPHIGWSLLEEVGGFGAAIIFSLLFGFLAGFFKGFREYLVPINGLFMAIPPIAWAPMMLIIFGIGYTTIVVVIFISAVNPMILTIMEGVLQIQGQEVRAARVLGAKRWQLFTYVYLPASLPFVTAALRIGFSQAWRALVAAEMIGASVGVGYLVQTAGEVGNMRLVLLGIVMIGLFSYLFERALFRPIEKRYEVWRLA